MHATGNHAAQLTNPQRALLAAILIGLPGLCSVILFAALHAHGPAPAIPGPVPVTVQPAPVSETGAPAISA